MFNDSEMNKKSGIASTQNTVGIKIWGLRAGSRGYGTVLA